MAIVKALSTQGYRTAQLGQVSTIGGDPSVLFSGPGCVREIVAVNTGSLLATIRVTHDENGHGHLASTALEWELPVAPGQAVHLSFECLGFPTKKGALMVSSSVPGVTFTAYGEPWT